MFLALLSILALVPELSSFLRYPAISTPFSYRIQTQLQDENTAGDYTDKNIEGYIDTATHLSDEEYAEVLTLAGLGDEQKEKEDLNLKVKDAMEKEWDLRVRRTNTLTPPLVLPPPIHFHYLIYLIPYTVYLIPYTVYLNLIPYTSLS